ncbi:MAG: tetratricopeptide repeat protein, partial [Methanobacteriota archaeon]
AEHILFHKARVLELLGNRFEEISCYDELIRINPENIYSWLKKGLAHMLIEEYDASIRCFTLASRLEDPGHMPFLLKGLVLSVRERFVEASSCFEEARNRSPGDTDVLLHLGRSLGSCNRTEEALEVFNQVLAVTPDNLEAGEGKARALYQLQQWDELCIICAHFRDLDPVNPVWYLLEVRTRGWHTGERDMALIVLKQARDLIPHDEHLLSCEADLLVEMNMTEEAIGLLTSGYEQDPSSIPYLYRLSTLLAELGEYSVAVEYFDKIYQLKPEDGQILFLAGEAYEHLGDYETALERYSSAITERPTDPEIWLARARVQLDLGEAQSAVISARQATSLSDDWFEAWVLLGRAEKEAGFLHESRKSLTYASVINPDDPDGWRHLGDVLFDLKEYPASSMAYSRILLQNPSDKQARNGKIRVLCSMGEWDSALAEYTAALTIRGENFWDLFGKGMVLINIDRVEEAQINLERSFQYAENDPVALFNLGNAWGELNDFSRAEELYVLSLELDSEDIRVWCVRGHTLIDSGNYGEAAVCFDRALEIDPENDEAFFGRDACLKALDGEGFALPKTGMNHQPILKSGE